MNPTNHESRALLFPGILMALAGVGSHYLQQDKRLIVVLARSEVEKIAIDAAATISHNP